MMNPNADFAEQVHLVPAFLPVDMSTAANNGDWVSLKGYERCTIVLYKNAGTAGDDPTLTLNQATAVDGTGSKALSVIDKVYVKQDTTLAAVGQYTVTTQTAGSTYTDATSAEDAAVWIIDVQAEDLDVANDFDCIQMSVADIGSNPQIGAAFYLLWPARYGQQQLDSAITD